MANPAAPPEADALAVRLYFFVAFDWGEEVNLERAAGLASSPVAELARRLAALTSSTAAALLFKSAVADLSRRPRTPTSIAYKPPPLRFTLETATLALPGAAPLPLESTEATVFDFGAVSVRFKASFRSGRSGLAALAGRLTDPEVQRALVQAARQAVTPLHQAVLPAVTRPHWNPDLWEEYFIFHFPPGAPLLPDPMLADDSRWLAGLLRLEDQPLSDQEATEAVRLTLRYGVKDLFVPDWAACVLLDDEPACLETLQVIEFANLQLLEYRHIDDRLDADLSRASALIERAGRSRLPFWHGPEAPLRVLGQLRVEANGLFERTGNVLKLVGDPYLARVYRLLATRFHLREWERSIQRKLDVIEDVYQVVSDQTTAFRTEFLEVIVIILIVVEILLAFYHH